MTKLSRGSPGAALLAAVAVALAIEASCRTMPRGRPLEPVPVPLGPSVEALVPPPVVRVGILTDTPRVSLAADSGVVAWGSLDQGRRDRASVARATLVSVSAGAVARRYRVQVASLSEEAAARTASERARRAFGLSPAVRWSADAGTYQVRIGEFESRDEAATLAMRLGAAGLEGSWVAEDPPAVRAGRLRLLETGGEYGSVLVVPASASEALTVDGIPYRGLVEVRANDSGTLTVINIVSMEDYLRGVVPNELSPQAYPRLEALKAQAVAARTYALRNRGQFEAKGYDVCATAACQVYRGLSTEHALSNQAVEETRGVVAAYGGSPINAFYTSTCGGHTEDGANIFEGESAPYLKGVPCAPERSVWGSLGTTASAKPLGGENGLNRDVALLVALGVLEPRMYSERALKGVPTEAEVREWTNRLVAALRRSGCESTEEPPLARRGSFFAHIVASLCWEERGRRLLLPQDPDYLLHVEDRVELGGERQRLAAALLVQEGVLSPLPDNTLRPGIVITRAQAAGILARAALRAGAPALLTGEFQAAGEGELRVRRGGVIESYPIDPAVRLFRSLDGARAAASELVLAPGDKVSFVLQDGRVSYLEAEQSRLGIATDRTSRFYRWEVRLTPAELAQGLARYGSVGEVKDLLPRRIGVSGRVVELAVIGSEGEAVLRGLRIRWALGLRENLFVVDRERGPGGAVERFVFTGKGWGHGVGLCQVGSDGMAQAGATHEEILRHFYSGISLERAY